jgi:tryptophan synthase alpha chain
MARIASAFRRLGKLNEAALIPCVTVGYPSLDATRQLVPVMARQGADLIGLFVPAPNPHDGHPAIRRAYASALNAGVTLSDCLAVAAEARRANEIPLILVADRTTIEQYGTNRLAADAAASGIDGLFIGDLSPEASRDLKVACEANGIDLVLRVTSDNTEDELRLAAELAGGFICCAGLESNANDQTGAGQAAESDAEALVQRLRLFTNLPLAVYMRVSTPEQVARGTQFAGGVLVTSALAELIETLSEDDIIPGVAEFVRNLKEATAK